MAMLSQSESEYAPFMYFDNLTGDCLYNYTLSAQRPKFSYALAIVFGIPASIIIFITSVGNLFVLCFKARVGKRQTMLLIWNLGLADFLVGTFVLPQAVAYIIGRRWPFGRLMCKIWTSCDLVFCTASIVTLCVISVDRYIGVTRPLRYKMIVTKPRIIAAIIGIWVFSIGVLLATNNYTVVPTTTCYNEDICLVSNELKYVVHSVISAFFLPALVTLALYWKIYTVARQRERGLQQGLMIAIGDNFLSTLANPLRVHRGNMAQQQKVIKMHKRVAKTLGIVVSVFLITWVPFFSVYLIGYHCQCIPTIVLDILTWMGYCNSMINPIIYAFTVDEFKDSLKALVALVAGAVSMTPLCRFIGGHGRRYANGTVVNLPLTAAEKNTKKWARSSKAYSTMPLDSTPTANAHNHVGPRHSCTGLVPPPPSPRNSLSPTPTPSPLPNQSLKIAKGAQHNVHPQGKITPQSTANSTRASKTSRTDLERVNDEDDQFQLKKLKPTTVINDVIPEERTTEVIAASASNDSLHWSAKTYSVLVSSKVTGL